MYIYIYNIYIYIYIYIYIIYILYYIILYYIYIYTYILYIYIYIYIYIHIFLGLLYFNKCERVYIYMYIYMNKVKNKINYFLYCRMLLRSSFHQNRRLVIRIAVISFKKTCLTKWNLPQRFFPESRMQNKCDHGTCRKCVQLYAPTFSPFPSYNKRR